MNKSELILQVVEKTQLPKKKVEDLINAIFDAMTQALVEGKRIEIRGFGSFFAKQYGSYVGRNPKTGETHQVAPKRKAVFKTGKELRERVDGEEPGDQQATRGSPENSGGETSV